MPVRNVAIVATGDLDDDRIFDPAIARDNVLERFKLLREELQAHGMTCRTSDTYDPSDVDVLIFHDIMNELEIILAIVKSNPNVRLVYLPNEPAFVIPFHDECILPHLPVDIVLTWNDRIAERHNRVKKFNIGQPVIKKHNLPLVSFNKKKFISSIFAYKPPNIPGSLFAERLKAIEFFSKQELGIDLYGIGWKTSGLPFIQTAYRGRCERKLMVQKQYKFSIAYENSGTLPGLITEKIFDCFAARTVPIYLGTPNIEEYIPISCFIDFRRFRDYVELYDYLAQMSETRYQEYIDAASAFIEAPQYYQFTSTCYSEKMRHQIAKLADIEVTRSPIFIKWSLLKLIFCYPRVLGDWRRYRRFFTTILFLW